MPAKKDTVLSVTPNPSVDTLIETRVFRPGKVNRIRKEQAYPGGKGIHVALALNELGIKTKVLGIWAGDTGKWIRSQCADYGLECTGPEVDGRSRTCYAVTGAPGTEETELLGTGPMLSEKDYAAFLKAFEKTVAAPALICMSGSWPGRVEDDAYAKLVEIANRAKKKVILDCSGPLLEAALAEQPFGIHINKEEGRELFNTDDPVEIARHLYRYCTIAAVTSGRDGLYLMTEKRLWHATCEVEVTASAVGSGDCLVAGMAWAYLNHCEADELAAWAVASGAANCLREDLGMLFKKDVERLKKRARVKQLSGK